MRILIIFTSIILLSFNAFSISHPITKSKINNNYEDECKEIKEQIEIYIHNYFYHMKTPYSGVPANERRIQLDREWLSPAEKLASIKNSICKD